MTPLHCTTRGRVVYDRKPSPFRWVDVRRIVRSLGTPSVGNWREWLAMMEIVVRINLIASPAGWLFGAMNFSDYNIQPREQMADPFAELLASQVVITESLFYPLKVLFGLDSLKPADIPDPPSGPRDPDAEVLDRFNASLVKLFGASNNIVTLLEEFSIQLQEVTIEASELYLRR